MLISDLTRQYHNQKATSKKEVVTAKNIGKLMASVRGLTAGNIFEGTVNSIKNGQVVIGLSDGRLLSARLDTTMQLVQGQSMFFQVKSNDGNTVAIAPYMVDGEGVNLTLMNALKAANLPIEDRFLNMANTMMKEHMPIDKNSMTQMARIVMANPDMNVQTLVQMKKLNIPINTESVSQFENYMDDKSAIHLSMERLINEVSTTLSDKTFSLEQMKAFNSELLLILEDGIENDIKISAIQNNFSVQQQNLMSSDLTATNQLSDTKVLLNSDNIGNIYQTESGVSNNENLALHNKEGVVLQENDKIFTKTIAQSANGLEETLTEQLEIGDISNRDNVISKELVTLLKNAFGAIDISKKDSPASILHKLAEQIQKGDHITKDILTQVFSNKEMQTFLRDILEQQMFLGIKEVAEGERIQKLYKNLASKIDKIDMLLQNTGIKDIPMSQTLADVRGNIEFMNQLNQTYTYAQIPLKMANQNVSAQLYVYTNKRDLSDPERDLTAFLHLDLEHLGGTDVSIHMKKKQVDTKFYMDNDKSFALVQANMPILQERLRQKGYSCTMKVLNEEKKIDFVEDFLKKDAPSTAQLHRYSFDVRA